MKSILIFTFFLSSFASAKAFRFSDSKQCLEDSKQCQKESKQCSISVSAENFTVGQKAEIVVTQDNRIVKTFSGTIKSLSLKKGSLEALYLERATLLSKLSDKQLLVWLRKSEGGESLQHDNGAFARVPAGFLLVEGYFAPGNFVNNSTAHYCLGSK